MESPPIVPAGWVPSRMSPLATTTATAFPLPVAPVRSPPFAWRYAWTPTWRNDFFSLSSPTSWIRRWRTSSRWASLSTSFASRVAFAASPPAARRRSGIASIQAVTSSGFTLRAAATSAR